ncbi:MAG: hypothetical protein NTX25_06600 [Proteobacteria bacterium]|nr:hypothetical protein [Pseudomonadota bacterium]
MKTSRSILLIFGVLGLFSCLAIFLWSGTEIVGAETQVSSSPLAIDVPTDYQQKNEGAMNLGGEATMLRAELLQARHDIQNSAELEKASAEDVHHAPELILAAATKLAEVMELEATYPQQKAEFLNFYAECADDASVITVTRAQCLKRYMDSLNPDEAQKQQVLKDLPVSVVHLYQSL